MTKNERNREYRARERVRHPTRARDYSRRWRLEHPGYLGPRRQAVVDRVDAMKSATPCTDCGSRFPACCMDFDHRGGDKHREVGALVARSSPWETIAAEIAKCDLVCANCHRIRTKAKGSSGWTRTIEKDEQPKSFREAP